MQGASQGILKELPAEEPDMFHSPQRTRCLSVLCLAETDCKGSVEAVGGAHRQREEEASLLPVHQACTFGATGKAFQKLSRNVSSCKYTVKHPIEELLSEPISKVLVT